MIIKHEYKFFLLLLTFLIFITTSPVHSFEYSKELDYLSKVFPVELFQEVPTTITSDCKTDKCNELKMELEFIENNILSCDQKIKSIIYSTKDSELVFLRKQVLNKEKELDKARTEDDLYIIKASLNKLIIKLVEKARAKNFEVNSLARIIEKEMYKKVDLEKKLREEASIEIFNGKNIKGEDFHQFNMD